MIPVSNDTLLRVVRRRGTSPLIPPRVVGVDDWAELAKVPPATGWWKANGGMAAQFPLRHDRLRGTQPPRSCIEPMPRFIPAPAGNTRTDSLAVAISPVHPRACGEHQGTGFGEFKRDGSSPRLRGTPTR